MPRPTVRNESGYSVIEVLMAILLLSLGVIGSFALIDGANNRTSDNKGREGATSLARDLIESSRTIPFNSITQADLRPELSTHSGLDDAEPAAGWQIDRRNFVYTVEYTVCTVDDASDRLGDAASHDASFCPGTVSGSSAGGADRNPVDFMRVMFTIRWRDTRGNQTLRQSGLVNSTYRGPAVKTLTTPGTVTTGDSIRFDAVLTSRADSVKWSVDGRLEGDASGSGTAWSWNWDLGPACSTTATTVQDGTYFVSAAGYDRNGGTGGPKAVAVNLNRCAPSAPTGLTGGRNWGSVELSWAANPESDIVGYDVFRDGVLVPGCSSASATVTTCRDSGATGSGPWSYTVVAYDTTSSGRRAGAQSTPITVLHECGSAPCNTNPNAPSVSISGSTLTITAASPQDPDSGDSVGFYRVYRTSGPSEPSGPGARYDVVDNSAAEVAWTDAAPGSFYYWVTAVDSHYGESDLSAVVP